MGGMPAKRLTWSRADQDGQDDQNERIEIGRMETAERIRMVRCRLVSAWTGEPTGRQGGIGENKHKTRQQQQRQKPRMASARTLFFQRLCDDARYDAGQQAVRENASKDIVDHEDTAVGRGHLTRCRLYRLRCRGRECGGPRAETPEPLKINTVSSIFVHRCYNGIKGVCLLHRSCIQSSVVAVAKTKRETLQK